MKVGSCFSNASRFEILLTADHPDEIGFKELVEKSFSETNPSRWEYAYDANGNMIRDDNKGITSIEYNHLNLPRKVSKSTSEYIVYTYDATGRKLKQEVFGPQAKVTDYAGELIFENNELQFINHEEGRVVMTGAAPEYQYHLKDHLGNVRLTLTSTPGQETAATAGFETADMAEEQGEFLHYAHARRVQATLFDRTNGSSPGYSQRLNGSEKETYGLAKSLAVMPGDVVNAEVYVKYADPESSNWNTALTNLMLAIANNTGGIIVDGEQYATALTENDFPGVVNTGSSSAAVPKAFLNWMVFDADFQLLDGGFIQVSTAARETGTDGPHERLAKDNIAITQPGYVYIYLSNENGDLVEVFFDDFSVEHIHGEVVQVDDYYPFGLTYNSFQRENALVNRWRFQGQEHIDDLDLGWDSFKWRNHQPDIGRFFNLDPLAEKYYYNSPYAFSENCVTTHVELEGLERVTIHVSRFEPDRQSFQRAQEKFAKPAKVRNTKFGNVSTPWTKEALEFRVDLSTGEFEILHASDQDRNLFSQAFDLLSGRDVNELEHSIEVNVGGGEFLISGTVDEFNFSIEGTVDEKTINVESQLLDISEDDGGLISIDNGGTSTPGPSVIVGTKKGGAMESGIQKTTLTYKVSPDGNAIIDKSNDKRRNERTRED